MLHHTPNTTYILVYKCSQKPRCPWQNDVRAPANDSAQALSRALLRRVCRLFIYAFIHSCFCTCTCAVILYNIQIIYTLRVAAARVFGAVNISAETRDGPELRLGASVRVQVRCTTASKLRKGCPPFFGGGELTNESARAPRRGKMYLAGELCAGARAPLEHSITSPRVQKARCATRARVYRECAQIARRVLAGLGVEGRLFKTLVTRVESASAPRFVWQGNYWAVQF